MYIELEIINVIIKAYREAMCDLMMGASKKMDYKILAQSLLNVDPLQLSKDYGKFVEPISKPIWP